MIELSKTQYNRYNDNCVLLSYIHTRNGKTDNHKMTLYRIATYGKNIFLSKKKIDFGVTSSPMSLPREAQSFYKFEDAFISLWMVSHLMISYYFEPVFILSTLFVMPSPLPWRRQLLYMCCTKRVPSLSWHRLYSRWKECFGVQEMVWCAFVPINC